MTSPSRTIPVRAMASARRAVALESQATSSHPSGGPYGPPEGWEEVAWHSNATARRALAMALTAMLRDGDITRARALEIARMVLHDNAARLYGLPVLGPSR